MLMRQGSVALEVWLVRGAGIPARRKAALVVAALLGDRIPKSAKRRVPVAVNGVIISFL